MSEKLRTIVIVIVTVAWALNVTVPIFVKDYEPIPELSAAFMGLVGLIIVGKGNDGGGGGNNPPEPPQLQNQASQGSSDADSA